MSCSGKITRQGAHRAHSRIWLHHEEVFVLPEDHWYCGTVVKPFIQASWNYIHTDVLQGQGCDLWSNGKSGNCRCHANWRVLPRVPTGHIPESVIAFSHSRSWLHGWNYTHTDVLRGRGRDLWSNGKSGNCRCHAHGRELPRVPTGHIPESDSMVGTTFIQMFFRAEVVTFGLTVSPGIADVMLIAELGSAVKLTAQCSMGCPVGYIQEVTPLLEVYWYRCSPLGRWCPLVQRQVEEWQMSCS